jgi:hypothetical protein
LDAGEGAWVVQSEAFVEGGSKAALAERWKNFFAAPPVLPARAGGASGNAADNAAVR